MKCLPPAAARNGYGIRSDRRAVYVIRITEYGVTLTKVYRKRGVIPWPQKGKGFGQKGMEMLLEMI